MNKLLEKIRKNWKYLLSNFVALVCLICFQWTLYRAIVVPNESNLLPIKHIVKLNRFDDAPNLVLKSNSVESYKTDSVEVVKGHFNFRDMNITMQLLLLSICAVVCFGIFFIMKISPAPFLVPLFLILTVSVFYHNYLGHRVIDNLSINSIGSVVCDAQNCNNSKDVGIIKCKNDNQNDPEKYECLGIPEKYIKKIPCKEAVNEKIECSDVSILKDPIIIAGKGNKDKYVTEDNGLEIVKIVRIDKEKMKKRAEINKALDLGVYANAPSRLDKLMGEDENESKQYIKFESEYPNVNDSNISETENADNKYRRASQDSREHFWTLLAGLLFFLLSMIFVKHLSTVRLSSDSAFRFWIGFFGVVGIALVVFEKFAMEKGDGVTSLGEYAKFASVILTVIGYERVNKNIGNFLLYIGALFLGAAALNPFLGLNDSGNMIILCVIVWMVFFIIITRSAKIWKILFYGFTSLLVLVVAALIIHGFSKSIWETNSNVPWRLKDTFHALENPLYKCQIPENPKQSFYSTKVSLQICSIKDNENVVGWDMVKNCETKDEKQECELDTDSASVFSNHSQVSYDYDENGEIKGIKKIQYDSDNCSQIKCKQVNKDSRLAIFAVLKDGFLGGGSKDKLLGRPAGFKGNTFLLHNHYMYTDFVFDGLIAFFGLFLTGVVFLSFLALIWNCRIKPKQCGNNYKHFLYSNIMVTILATQAVIHIGGNLNIIPFTGVILPFLSRAIVGTLVSFVILGFALGGLVSDDFMKPIEDKWSDFKGFCRNNSRRFRLLTAKNNRK